MNTEDLLKAFAQAGKRALLVGDAAFGAVVAPDLEGRIYLVYQDDVVSRVNLDAIQNYSDRHGYRNPGGDGLWPAPEGTTMGYEYDTGAWRVPPGLTRARFEVIQEAANYLAIEAEVSLINSEGRGIPTIFRRYVTVQPEQCRVKVVEEIEFIGRKPLTAEQCLLSPWTLSQFDTPPGTVAYFPECAEDKIRELYDSSARFRSHEDGLVKTLANSEQRYQLALGEETPWIEMALPEKGVRIRRWADDPAPGTRYVDIADADPDTPPTNNGVKYSIYSDPSGFMELEAVAAVGEGLKPGDRLNVAVYTSIEKL